MQVLFSSEGPVIDAIISELQSADTSVRIMAFVFTLDEVRDVLLDKAAQGVTVQGIFDSRQATTQYSELPPLYCAGNDMRIDGNPYVLHHKVFIIDDDTVVTGSFNFSASAAESNDENVVIIQDPAIARLYIDEFNRRWAEAYVPDDVACN